MSFVPGVPDCDIVPALRPGHLEHAETAMFEYLHAVGFYGDLAVGFPRPGLQLLFCVFISHDHNVHGLRGPEIADGHLM